MTRQINSRKPLQLHSRFHGRPPVKVLAKSFRVPESLVYLGQAVAIVYKCDKKHGGGDGTMTEYEHTFETPVGLYMDETGKKQLYICGDKLKVTSAGIEN